MSPPYEIAGLPNTQSADSEPPYWSNVIDQTLAIRRVSQGSIPVAFVLISNDGGDYNYWLDTTAWDQDSDCRVVELGPGPHGIPVADSFIDFVEKVKAGVRYPENP